MNECKAELKKLNFEELIEKQHRDFVFALKDGDVDKLNVKNLRSLGNDLLSNDRNGFEKFASLVTRFTSACQEGMAFMSSIWDILKTLNRDFGIFSGDILLGKFEEWIERKTGNKNLTFAELEEKILKKQRSSSSQTFKLLYVVGYSLESDEKIKIFSAEHTPNDVVAHAVRISMSIPVFFKPHRRRVKHPGDISPSILPGFFVDGGIAKNDPLDIFDNLKYYMNCKIDQFFFNTRVINFKLVSAEENAFYLKKLPAKVVNEPQTIFQYLGAIVGAIMSVEEANFRLNKTNLGRTILINSGNITAVDFNLDINAQQILIEAGIEGARLFTVNQVNSFPIDAEIRFQVIEVLRSYLNIDLKILYTTTLETLALWNNKILETHDTMLVYKLAEIPDLTKKNLRLLVFHFKINLSAMDSCKNTAAHLLAAVGNLEALKKICYLKPNMLLLKNAEGFSPIHIFYIRHASNQDLWEQFHSFCLQVNKNAGQLAIKHELGAVLGSANSQLPSTTNWVPNLSFFNQKPDAPEDNSQSVQTSQTPASSALTI